ncbi:MAG TPA: mismatch-specific DNA-glycosylase [Terriglobia bacterium]|nr:mismatch-specific DNA-glycosylase [Terriglobia bacterium]
MPRQLPDYLRPGLKVVFVGFNPGERSARLGHYYAGRGNQFWNFLFEAGLLPVKLGWEEDCRVLEFGFGLTDLVKRWSKSSSEVRAREYRKGIGRLNDGLQQAAFGARVVAFNGKGAYENFRGSPCRLGWQPEPMAGARVFVLPSTSGRNRRLTRTDKLEYFRRLARWVNRNAE